MVAIRHTSSSAIRVGCPVCGELLPPILVELDTRSTGRVADGGVVLNVTLEPQELDAAWWNAARQAHPACIPERPRVQGWQ